MRELNHLSVREQAFRVQPCLVHELSLLMDRLGEDHGLSNQMSVLSTTRFPEAVLGREVIAYDRILTLQDFAEFFAELCASEAPFAPITPMYSIENTTTPAFSPRLLTEGL